MVPTTNTSKLFFGNMYVSTNQDIEYNFLTVTAGSAFTKAYTPSQRLTAWGSSNVSQMCCDRVGTSDTFVIQTTRSSIYTVGTVVVTDLGTATPTLALIGDLDTDYPPTHNAVNLTMQNGYLGTNTTVMAPSHVVPSSITQASTAVYTPAAGTTTANKFIGISEAAISDGASGAVTVVSGTNTGVSGLTAGETYFLQADGSLATTKASINYGEVGKALTATSILISGVGDTSVSSQ